MSSRPSKHFKRSRLLIYQLNANSGEGTVMTEKYRHTHTEHTHPRAMSWKYTGNAVGQMRFIT